MGEAYVDNLDCLDGDLCLWDMDLFRSFTMEIGNSEGDFCIVKLGLNTQEGVLGSSTAR